MLPGPQAGIAIPPDCGLGYVREGVRMDKDIARLNIEHFRKLLERETDEERRAMLLRLLAEEEAKLNALPRDPRERKRSG
jgi:hypothetical protein